MCSAEIIASASCYLDNWDKIADALAYVFAYSIIFGTVVGLITLINKN